MYGCVHNNIMAHVDVAVYIAYHRQTWMSTYYGTDSGGCVHIILSDMQNGPCT